MARLGDICEVLNGFAFRSEQYVDKGFRIIRISNVQKGYIEDSAPVFYPLDSEEAKKYALKEDDLLISLTGNVGRVGILSSELLPATLNQRVACIRIKNESQLTKCYLFNFLNSDYFETKCIESAKGVAQKNMSTEWLKDYEIPLISLEEQRRIAALLDRVSDLIAKRRAQLDKLDLLIKARFVEMFGDQYTNPKGWETGTIRDVVSEVRYGTSRPAVEGGAYKYLRMGNITFDGHLDLNDLKYIDIPKSEIEKCIVKKGDVLFNRTNSKELVGKTCVFDIDESMVIAGYIIRVRVNERVLPDYLSAVLNSQYGKRTLADMCKAIVGQANINAQELQSIAILIPPIELQRQFSQFVNQVNKLASNINCGLEKLETLKKALIQQYFG